MKTPRMLNNHPIKQLIHSTVRILCTSNSGKISSGTGYVFLFCEKTNGDSIPCIVTNKHVVKNAKRGSFNLTLKNTDGTPNLGSHESVTVENIEQYSIPHPDPAIDLVAFPIAPILNHAKRNDKDYYLVPLTNKLIASHEFLNSISPMEEIVMIGYPNGIWDEAHNLPIIRKGITATHPKLRMNNKPEFLIDAACFPGSSGSPVFLANIGGFLDHEGNFCVGNRIRLLGTLYAGPQHTTEGEIIIIDVPTDTKPIAIGTIPNNLGYVIQASELFKLEAVIDEKLNSINTSTSRNADCPCGSGKRYKHCCGTTQ
ncbi:SEC-C motif domain protein [Pseudomonas syringae pv. tagetis]|uniref:SEC-C motif domain protein n=2 Tax=Pseudomonas syringae group TaxID=136849 RepID=A0A3M3YX42_9PSED|nr:SEC-C motif domain protein [Pseudomonas syringae pv. tagetis]